MRFQKKIVTTHCGFMTSSGLSNVGHTWIGNTTEHLRCAKKKPRIGKPDFFQGFGKVHIQYLVRASDAKAIPKPLLGMDRNE